MVPTEITIPLSMRKVINAIASICAEENKRWDYDPVTGELLNVNVAEKIALMHSELSEAMEGHRKGLMDDKLPNRPMIEVEFADAVIRIFHEAHRQKLDIGGALVDKLLYNRTRQDHTNEARAAEGGKKY